MPEVKKGDAAAAQQVLNSLKVPYMGNAKGGELAQAEQKAHSVTFKAVQSDLTRLPDLKGLGARDAVYAVESRGMKARLHGVGKVMSQSVPAGSKVKKEGVVFIELN